MLGLRGARSCRGFLVFGNTFMVIPDLMPFLRGRRRNFADVFLEASPKSPASVCSDFGRFDRFPRVMVFVCCCRPIYSERRFSPLGRVSRGHTGGRPTHRRFFFFICFWFSTFLLRCLPFFFVARRVQHSLSLVDREVEFCVPTTKSLSTVGCCARKNPRLHRDLNPRPNRQKVTRLPTEPPGRPVPVPKSIDVQSNMHPTPLRKP